MPWIFLVLILAGVAGCDASLPEPGSPAAQLYQKRCSGCHRVYAPQVLTAQMWGFMVDRMEHEFRRRGLPPLSPDEKQIILDYLQKHSRNGAVSPSS